LPPGLSLVSDPLFTAQAHITGTPTTPGTYLYAIQFTDGAGNTAQQTYQLKVSPMALFPGSGWAPLGECDLPQATSGTPYRQALQVTGVSGYTNYSILGGTLPPGFSLDPSGVISGTTSNNGTFGIHLYASNASGSLNRACNLNVVNRTYYAASILAFENTPDPLLNSRGLYVQPMPRSVGEGSSVAFTQYGGVGPVSWSFAPGSQVPPGMTLAASGDSAFLSGVPTLAGAYVMTPVATDGDGSVSQRTFTVDVGLLSAPGVVAPLGQVGVPYSYQIRVLYGTPPYTFGLDPASFLPAGLSLAPSGLISGTPLTGGRFQLSMFYHVTDANGYATSSALSLPIITATQAYDLRLFSGLTPPDGSVGVYYTSPPLTNWVYQGIAPYSFALAQGSSLPNGLAITTNGAGVPVIAGTPTQTGDTVFTLTVTDGQNRTATTQLVMSVRQMRVTPASLPPGATGTPYLQTLTAAGGTPPYTFTATNRFSVTPGLGCPGLTLSGSGVVSGTPTQNCTGTAVVVVTDSASPTQQTLTLNYAMSIGPPGTAITVINATPGSVSTSWTQGNPAPSPIPVQVTGAPGSVAFTVSTSVGNGSGWLSAVPTAGSTPGGFNIILSPGPAALSLGTYTGTVTVTAPNAYNSPIFLAVTLVVSAPVTCSYTVSPASAVIPSSGGSGNFFVNTQPGCAWTAGLTSAPSGGITPTSSLSGTGPGTVTYTVPNPSSQANITSGVFQAGDQSNIVNHTVYQQGTACSFVTTPSSITAPASGGPVTVNLSASNSSCPWIVSGMPGWISPSPASGAGGGAVTLTLSPNGGSTLNTTLSIGGASLPVTESGASCTGSLSPATDSLSSTGGTGRSATLTIQNGCFWTAAAPSWVSITSAASGSGGATTLTYDVAPNSSLQGRSANIQVAGQTLTVTETGVPCSFSVSGDGVVQPWGGGSGSISVGANGSGCSWVASSNTSWITLNPAQGNGNGAASYTVGSNSSSSSRTGTVTVAAQSLVIAQSGTTCSVTLASSEAVLTATGGQISIGVQAPSNCGWTATDGDSWVTLQGAGSGVGNGTILYQIGANASSNSRASTVSISPGASFNIAEAGAVTCTYTALYAGNGGGPASIGWQASVGTFNYNASPATGCVAAPVQSFSSWLSLSSPPTYTSPTGTVGYAAATNNSPAARTGYIMTGGSPYVVAQAASPCTYALGTMEATFGGAGGPGSIAVTASPSSGCTPYISADTRLGSVSLTGTGSLLTVNYTVPAFTPFLPTTRILTITIGGQAFSVKQVSE
jgi:hypothetical protein